MFDGDPRLMLEVTFGVQFAYMRSVNTEKYVVKLRSHLKWAYKVTCKTNMKEIKTQKENMARTLDVPNWNQGTLFW